MRMRILQDCPALLRDLPKGSEARLQALKEFWKTRHAKRPTPGFFNTSKAEEELLELAPDGWVGDASGGEGNFLCA